jgi:hypothetical protein
VFGSKVEEKGCDEKRIPVDEFRDICYSNLKANFLSLIVFFKMKYEMLMMWQHGMNFLTIKGEYVVSKWKKEENKVVVVSGIYGL